MTDVAVVSGTRRAAKELVDGTIRVQVDIDPRFRRAFFDLFPDIDTPIALAPLRPAAVVAAARAQEEGDAKARAQEQAAAPRAPQRLSQYAALLCREPMFQVWLADTNPTRWRDELQRAAAIPVSGHVPPEALERAAAAVMRSILGVESRAELDTNPAVAGAFHTQIREPYAAWVAEREGRL